MESIHCMVSSVDTFILLGVDKYLVKYTMRLPRNKATVRNVSEEKRKEIKSYILSIYT